MSIIEHTGKVVKQEGNRLSVLIEQQSACAVCHARSMCSVSEKDEKIVVVDTHGDQFKIDEQVVLFGHTSLGFKAVLIAYILPLVVIFLTLVITTKSGIQEIWVGIIALCSLLPYFLVLSIFNKKIQKKFILNVMKLK